uniref:Uncharacterized protein n=1 Tax=Caenorhabditis japonica TaxID=281687 RepID=A0A8R1EH96_CAEJA
MECCGLITLEQRAADAHFHERTIFYSHRNLYSLPQILNRTDDRRKLDADVVHMLVSNLRDLQPDATVTPKLHLLAAHLVLFLTKHKSWVRMTEQGLESL